MERKCNSCADQFRIEEEDLRFYDRVSPIFNDQKYSIPPPKLCPDCRQQRRLVWRNERKLYKRSCDLCRKNMLSKFPQGTSFPVYCVTCWWSDRWNPLEYGRNFDFSKPFFEQFVALRETVPELGLSVLQETMENSEYCNQAGYLKDCYLVVNSDESEKCLYGKGVNRSFFCVDCFKIYDCESCYQSLNCNNCAFSTYLLDAYDCHECHFSASLTGCQNCFGCINLRNQKYCFFNEPCSKSAYEEKVLEILRQQSRAEIWQKFLEFRSRQVAKRLQEKHTEDSTGDYLVETKNCKNCFDCEYLENSKYCTDLKKGDRISFENHDIAYFGMGVESSYECSVAGYSAHHQLFCAEVWNGSDVFYSYLCLRNTKQLFGCAGLKHQKYCIFNKQYSKQEYDELVPRIIQHMIETGEWGEFFPVDLSPFAYNETTAQEYFPFSREQAKKRNWRWKEEDVPDFSGVTKKIPAEKLPDSIAEIPDDILNWAIVCAESQRLFQIQKAELEFYRKMNLPIPKLHPDLRYEKRFQIRNPRKLWQRSCSNCQKSMETTYAPGSREIVYCEDCYLKAVY